MARLKFAAPFILGLTLAGCATVPEDNGAPGATGSLMPMDAPKDAAAAVDYWSTAYGKNPHNEQAAISYAHALKADGSKDKALGILEQASFYNPDSKLLAGEEGRLALDLGQQDLAEKLLARANDPAHPDWRVLNALGTLQAQKNDRAGAQGYFEKANRLAPNDPAVLNNLALSYALGGDAARAEALLRKAVASGTDVARIRQNLALVLGVEGKYDESQQVSAADLGADKARANRAYLEKMVDATPIQLGKRAKPAAAAAPLPWQAAVDTPPPTGPAKPADDAGTAWVVDVAGNQPAQPTPAAGAQNWSTAVAKVASR